MRCVCICAGNTKKENQAHICTYIITATKKSTLCSPSVVYNAICLYFI